MHQVMQFKKDGRKKFEHPVYKVHFKQNLYFFWILVRAFTFFRDVLKLYFIFFWILFREWLSISGDNICPPPPAQCITSLSSWRQHAHTCTPV